MNGSERAFYSQLRKPFFTPPPAVFPIVWSILYALLGYLFLLYPSPLFAFHLMLNLLWTPVFFGQENVGGALLILLGMLGTAFALRPTLPWTFDLYVAWITFAGILNASIYVMN